MAESWTGPLCTRSRAWKSARGTDRSKCGVHGESVMGKKFKAGDHVSWNSEAGRVSGHIVKVHTSDVNYKGYIHHASEEDPQYEIKSDKTDHVAMHKGKALRHLGN